MTEITEAQKANTTEELTDLVNQYLKLDTQRKAINETIRIIETPEQPKEVASLEELQAYAKAEEQFESMVHSLERERSMIQRQQEFISRAIKDSLPAKGVWVRVGNYAVGKYYSTWGGGHYDLSINEWRDNLPELLDQTYFP